MLRIGRMPVARGIHGDPQRARHGRQPIEHRNHAIAPPNAQRAAGTEVVLQINDEERRAAVFAHVRYGGTVMSVPSALATDLYQLTMMAGYDAAGYQARTTFE